MVSPVRENAILNVRAGVPSMMSVPIRSQSGAKSELRIQACKSPKNGVPGGTIGFGADRDRKLPPVTTMFRTEKLGFRRLAVNASVPRLPSRVAVSISTSAGELTRKGTRPEGG